MNNEITFYNGYHDAQVKKRKKKEKERRKRKEKKQRKEKKKGEETTFYKQRNYVL